MTPEEAYYFAKNNPDCDIKKYQKIACNDSYWPYIFAANIFGANIKYCQRHACKDPLYALWFAEDIPEANISLCYEFSEIFRERIREIIDSL